MRKDVQNTLKLCATCQVVKSRPVQVSMTDMPFATYPFQIIKMDLVGPFCVSPEVNQ